MRTNASTNTTLEIENHKEKKLSLQPLFKPEIRYLLLYDKVVSFNRNNKISIENQKNLANKSIFIFNYKNKKRLNDSLKIPNSVKNIFSDKFKLKKININNKYNSRNSSIKDYNSIDNKNIYKISSKNIFNESKIISIKKKPIKLKFKNLNNRINQNININRVPNIFKTAHKKKLSSFSFKPKMKINFSDVKSKEDFKNNIKMNEIKEQLKCKLFNNNNENKKNKNYNFSIVNKKGKFNRFRIAKNVIK